MNSNYKGSHQSRKKEELEISISGGDWVKKTLSRNGRKTPTFFIFLSTWMTCLECWRSGVVGQTIKSLCFQRSFRSIRSPVRPQGGFFNRKQSTKHKVKGQTGICRLVLTRECFQPLIISRSSLGSSTSTDMADSDIFKGDSEGLSKASEELCGPPDIVISQQ